jgi:hypothetical protein
VDCIFWRAGRPSLPSTGLLSFPQVMVEWIDNWLGKRETLRQKPVLETKWNMIREWEVIWRLWKPSHTKQSSLCLFTIFWEIAYFKHRWTNWFITKFCILLIMCSLCVVCTSYQTEPLSLININSQTNQPTRRISLSDLLLVVQIQLNMFRASSCPSSGAYKLQ